MLKIILDANIIISAFVFEGKIRDVFDFVAVNHVLCFSDNLVFEVKEKLINKFFVDKKLIKNFDKLISKSKHYYPKTKIDFSADEKDAYLLELAEESKADYLITGDKKHLLPLKKWRNTIIISPANFVKLKSQPPAKEMLEIIKTEYKL